MTRPGVSLWTAHALVRPRDFGAVPAVTRGKRVTCSRKTLGCSAPALRLGDRKRGLVPHRPRSARGKGCVSRPTYALWSGQRCEVRRLHKAVLGSPYRWDPRTDCARASAGPDPFPL